MTERGAAIDSFYVRELDGGKIISAERRILIERQLREAINRLDAADDRGITAAQSRCHPPNGLIETYPCAQLRVWFNGRMRASQA